MHSALKEFDRVLDYTNIAYYDKIQNFVLVLRRGYKKFKKLFGCYLNRNLS